MRWTFYPAADFGKFAPLWNALNAETANLPFFDAAFLRVALSQFGSGREYLGIFGDGDAPTAMGLFHRLRNCKWETFQPSQLPLGAFLIRRGHPVGDVLASGFSTFPGITLLIALTQLDPDVCERPAGSRTLETVDYIDTARLTIRGSFEDYWAARGKNLRQNIKKQFGKLTHDGVRPALEVVTDSSGIAAAILEYGRLESAGWKARQGTAVSSSNAQGRFYREAFEALANDGTARIYSYRFDGRVVAMDLCLIRGSTMIVLKTTYDETIKGVSPAFLMRYEYFKLLFDRREVERIEFYGRVMEWHLRWTDDVRRLYHIDIYRWPWLRAIHRAIRGGRTPLPSREPSVASGGVV